MWHLQLPKWLKQLSLEIKIICASIIGHVCVLFCLLVLYRGSSTYNVIITSTMINTDVPIVFMPLYKSIQQKSSVVQTHTPKNQDIQNNAKPLDIKEEHGAGTFFGQPASGTKKLIKTKKQTKKMKQQKKQEKKEIKQQEKKQQLQKEQPQKVIQSAQQVHEVVAAQPAPVAPAVPQDAICLGQQEMEALQLQNYIQQEIAQHWSPPGGMRKDLSCIIKLIIAFDGSIAQIVVDQPSGVLLFDGAARKAVGKLQPPSWAYGKELSITFKP